MNALKTVAIVGIPAALLFMGAAGNWHGSAAAADDRAQRELASPTGIAAATASPLRALVPDAPVLFPATGGPYIGQQAAISMALKQMQNPVRALAAGFLLDRDVSQWAGGRRTATVDPQREMYMVALLSTYVPQHGTQGMRPCQWVVLVIDATDGLVRSLHCGWEMTLPSLPAGVLPVPIPDTGKS